MSAFVEFRARSVSDKPNHPPGRACCQLANRTTFGREETLRPARTTAAHPRSGMSLTLPSESHA